MKRVLLTGATGFIGRHCLPLLLERGYEVHAVSSASPVESPPDVRWYQVDLLDLALASTLVAEVQPTHLLHLAWLTTPGKYWTSPQNLRWVQASLELLQAFARCGGRRVVMAGTCAEYDWEYGYCSEKTTPLRPTTLYGTCKHSLQMTLEAFADQTGLSSAWGRIFFLYGPYEHPDRLVSSVVRALLQGQPARCTHGNQIRDFLYVEDVADAFVALLESDNRGAVNIASGYPVVLKDVVWKIADKLDRRDLIQLGAVAAPASEPPLIVGDARLLKGGVGWLPKFDLDSGVEQTLDWWRKYLFDRHG
jgi:nucleoside-diphosphate-sugar epimerase